MINFLRLYIFIYKITSHFIVYFLSPLLLQQRIYFQSIIHPLLVYYSMALNVVENSVFLIWCQAKVVAFNLADRRRPKENREDFQVTHVALTPTLLVANPALTPRYQKIMT